MGQRGFTLVELLIALAIFSVLGVASWQVLHQVIASKQTIDEQSLQLRQLQKTLWLISQDLRSMVDRPVRDNHGNREPAVSSIIPGYKLVFTRNGRENPLNAPRSELQRIAYGIEEGESATQLIRYSWPVLDRATSSEPVKQVLLASIDRLELQFVDRRGQTVFYWPPAQAEDDTSPPSVPAGIRLQFSLPLWGDVEKIIQIRDVNPS